jgi:pyruvate/2-oxoglutarate dehydrogenase complex dihydrolipoamide dehydrogenase (E3) component
MSNKGIIPPKILLYPAELIRTIERTHEFGIFSEIKKIDFEKVMGRMQSNIQSEISD